MRLDLKLFEEQIPHFAGEAEDLLLVISGKCSIIHLGNALLLIDKD